MAKIKLGDTVRLPTGAEGRVIGTMTSLLVETGKLAPSVGVHVPPEVVWLDEADVELVAKAPK